MREDKLPAVKRLDSLKLVKGFEYIPITTEIMETASEFWAWARVTGQQTASDDSLDGDVILAATAKTMSMKGKTVVIATTNVGHLQRYHTYTKDWRDNDWHNLKEAKF